MNRAQTRMFSLAIGFMLAISIASAQTKPSASAHRASQKSAAATADDAAAPASGVGAVSTPGKRDPFINPIEAVREGRQGNCQGGKRCLAVNEIVLRGVVKSVNGMIAVVENSAQRTYFLHENDPIYNGFVKKITPDSVVFRERVIDNIGRQSEHDVVKTVNAPVV